VNKENKQTELTEKDIEKYFDTIAKHLSKLVNRIHNNMSDNNQSIDFLIEQLSQEPNPLIFALSGEIGTRKFLKWALAENIKRNQALIDKITEIEKARDLPLEYED
jgi:hypothetical protein